MHQAHLSLFSSGLSAVPHAISQQLLDGSAPTVVVDSGEQGDVQNNDAVSRDDGGGDVAASASASVSPAPAAPSSAWASAQPSTIPAAAGTTSAAASRAEPASPLISRARPASPPPRQIRHGSFSVGAGMVMTSQSLHLLPEFAKDGFMEKRGGGRRSSGFRKRYFVLCGEHLFYFKTKGSKAPAKGVISPLSRFEAVTSLMVDSHDREVAALAATLGPKDIVLLPRNALLSQDDTSAAAQHAAVVSRTQSPPKANQKSSGGTRTWYLQAPSVAERNAWVSFFPDPIDPQLESMQTRLATKSFFVEPHEIDFDIERRADKLGSGGAGLVTRGMWLGSVTVAVKVINNLPEFQGSADRSEFLAEIDLLSQLRHPRIVSMFGYTNKEGRIALITEYVEGGDLGRILHSPPAQSVPMSYHIKLLILQNICSGMVFLHNRNILHRDLKPQQILVQSLLTGDVKICDFGLSWHATEHQSSIPKHGSLPTTVQGTPAYAAPEMQDRRTPDTTAVDVFSFGIMCWEVCCRRLPWTELEANIDISTAIHRGARPPLGLIKVDSSASQAVDDFATEALRQLMTQCWQHDPSVRLKFVELFAIFETLLDSLPDDQGSILAQSQLCSSYDGVSLYDLLSRVLFCGDPFMSFDSWALAVYPHMFPMGRDRASVPRSPLEIVPVRAKLEDPDPLSELESFRQLVADSKRLMQSEVTRRLLSWFRPLVPGAGAPGSWTVEAMMAVLDHPSFIGFASSGEAELWLEKRKVGSYLIRLASAVGLFALSATAAPDVVLHWKIVADAGSGRVKFTFVDEDFYSFDDLVKSKSEGGATLKSKSPPVEFHLRAPLTKKDIFIERESVYVDNYS